jgi:transcriptional regulator with XRE-family HTH domain
VKADERIPTSAYLAWLINHNRIYFITTVFEFNRSITDVNQFSDRLRHARKLRGLSQAQLAHACGLSQGAIANYESRARRHAKDIFRLAQALNVNAEWLGTGAGPIEPMAAWPSWTASAPHTLSDKLPEQRPAWPFANISPSVYWSLTDNERAMLEQALIGMLAALGKKNTGI